ncbi:hypothetical protein QBZ16_000566 [Prototheca wickerhamii]|uniref:AP2/ERF domain-containing protein n=1 Tax=Prototheca wickerhamii TaxID=3111 RepID=A0AAD9IQ12_PROWI|nr:hypothetical protein QBZ16_000566 [Prototheca wickerhamii]
MPRGEPSSESEPSPKRWGSGTFIPAFYEEAEQLRAEGARGGAEAPREAGWVHAAPPAPARSKAAWPQDAPEAASPPPGGRTSNYRGVSRHRLTKRWEASLWLNGRQLYLGGFNSQEDAAAAYDLAALACKGPGAVTNHPPDKYAAQLKEDEVVAHVRRRSNAFSRGKSKYRGVSGHNGRWEARIGSFGGRKNVSFGIFETEDEAARQYDRALILEKGRSAKTNFPLQEYEREVAEHEARAALRSATGKAKERLYDAVARAAAVPRDRLKVVHDGQSIQNELHVATLKEAGDAGLVAGAQRRRLPTLPLLLVLCFPHFWLGVAAWCVGAHLSARAELGPLYILGTIFILIAINLGQRAAGQASAYSIFNNFRRLPGQLTAEDLDHQLRHGQM